MNEFYAQVSWVLAFQIHFILKLGEKEYTQTIFVIYYLKMDPIDI